MTPEEARLTQLGSAIAAAHLEAREDDKKILLDALVPDEPRWADVFVYTAMSAASMIGKLRDVSPRLVMRSLEPRQEALFPPEAGVAENWAAVRDLIIGALANDDAVIRAASAQVDSPTVFASSFSIAIAAFEERGQGTPKTAAEWATICAVGAARET
jgi:hypothetical protein